MCSDKQIPNPFDSQRPLIIAGPCSAESAKQVMDTAMALKDIPGLFAFRAGLWKPRTRPGDFEGVGEKGLLWLTEAKRATGLKLAVEIATPAHAEACLAAGVDFLWIGARSVVNPFLVDDIARALSGSNIGVMVKNPVNPDIGLWSGAIERLMKKGISRLAAVHRGFNIYLSKPYRNAPLWEIPLEMMAIFRELPMLCDPSHIGGKREMLASISQKALDLGMDGLMVESHINPAKALTDPAQQVTPGELARLVGGLKTRKSGVTKGVASLEKYRTSIDELDEQLLELISRRLEVAGYIGELKKAHDLAPYQPERWARLLEDRMEKASKLRLDPDFVKKIFTLIHKESLGRQGEVIDH